jgi:uncharacterized membrane protein YphA (DoxX/SURF4 family)
MKAKILALRSRALQILERLRFVPPTLARFIIGWVFASAGWKELHDIDSTIDYFKDLGIPFPELQAPMSSSTLLVCGVLVFAGVLTRLAALPLAGVMTVAIVVAKAKEIWGVGAVLAFPEFLYIALLVFLIVDGPGVVSVDHLLSKRVSSQSKETV